MSSIIEIGHLDMWKGHLRKPYELTMVLQDSKIGGYQMVSPEARIAKEQKCLQFRPKVTRKWQASDTQTLKPLSDLFRPLSDLFKTLERHTSDTQVTRKKIDFSHDFRCEEQLGFISGIDHRAICIGTPAAWGKRRKRSLRKRAKGSLMINLPIFIAVSGLFAFWP